MEERHSWISYIVAAILAISLGIGGAHLLKDAISPLLARTSNYLAAISLGKKSLPPVAVFKEPIKESLPQLVSPTHGSTTVITFVGDIMLDRGVEQSAKQNARGDFNWLINDISKISNSDILFGNLEGPISNAGRDLGNAYSFRMDPAVLPVLEKAGFDIVSVANNHAGDWAADAFKDSVSRLNNSKIALIGGGQNYSEAIVPKLIVKNGLRYAWLAFSDVGPNWLAAGSSTPGILLASDPQTPGIIANASKDSDVLIVSYHFGDEYQSEPSWRQKQLAKMAIDNGAKIVVGHHPHVIQPTEKYKNGLIIYSLGNFIFDQYFSTSTMQGLAVKVRFNGKEIEDVEKLKTKSDWKFRVSVE